MYNIDDYGGVVTVNSPGWEDGECYGRNLDCRFTVYTEQSGDYIEIEYQTIDVSLA